MAKNSALKTYSSVIYKFFVDVNEQKNANQPKKMCGEDIYYLCIY